MASDKGFGELVRITLNELPMQQPKKKKNTAKQSRQNKEKP